MEKITNLELGFRDEIRFHLETMMNDTEYYDEIDIEKMAKITDEDINTIALKMLYDEELSQRINEIIENNVRNMIGVDYL